MIIIIRFLTDPCQKFGIEINDTLLNLLPLTARLGFQFQWDSEAAPDCFQMGAADVLKTFSFVMGNNHVDLARIYIFDKINVQIRYAVQHTNRTTIDY